MKIFKISYNSIKSFFIPYSKAELSKLGRLAKIFEPVKDTFIKSEKSVSDYLYEDIPTTKKLFQNLNMAFEKGKSAIKSFCQADAENLPQRTAIYGKAQEELIKNVQDILEKSENKQGVKAILSAMTNNDRIFEQTEISSYDKKYTTSAQYLIEALSYADTPQKLNTMYKFVKNIDFNSWNVRYFCDCLKNVHHSPNEIKLELMDKFTSKVFLPVNKDTSFEVNNYTKSPLYRELSELKKPEQFELLDKLTSLNDDGDIYIHLAGHLEYFSPEQSKFLSGMIDKNNANNLKKKFLPSALPIIKNCHTDRQFDLFKKYVTSPRVVSPSYKGSEFEDEIKLVGEIINKMEEFPIVASALKRFLDDKKYLNTAFDRGLYKILYSMQEKEKVKYLNVILNDPKLYDNDMFLTNLFLTKDTKEIDILIRKCLKGKHNVK